VGFKSRNETEQNTREVPTTGQIFYESRKGNTVSKSAGTSVSPTGNIVTTEQCNWHDYCKLLYP